METIISVFSSHLTLPLTCFWQDWSQVNLLHPLKTWDPSSSCPLEDFLRSLIHWNRMNLFLERVNHPFIWSDRWIFLLSPSTSTSSVFSPPLLSRLLLHPCLSHPLLFFSFGRISLLFQFDTSLFFSFFLFFCFLFFSPQVRQPRAPWPAVTTTAPMSSSYPLKTMTTTMTETCPRPRSVREKKKEEKKKWPLELFFLFCLSFSFSFGLRFIVRSINCEICQGDHLFHVSFRSGSASASCIWVTTKVILTLKGR